MLLIDGLEIDKITANLLNYFNFETNCLNYNQNTIITNSDVLALEHRFLSEAQLFHNKGNILILKKVKDLTKVFIFVSKQGVLDPQGLYNFENFLTNVNSFMDAFNKDPNLVEISNLSLDLFRFDNILNNIKKTVLPDFSISSEASLKLKEIRTNILTLSSSFNSAINSCKKKYANYLVEGGEVSKDGLPCLAVFTPEKNKVKGMVVDISNSGNTTFIVPYEILDLQNKISELKIAEENEINRILTDLSNLIRANLPRLESDYKICLKLDSIFARFYFGLSYNGTIAKISDEISIEEFAHPLLDEKIVVRNSIHLGNDKQKILIISGPNAGGKTVYIKAVCLACYMNQKGLMVDCLGEVNLKVFSSIFFLSGDNQSLLDNLSTFSSHISKIISALKYLSKDSLFIVDEIGQGTSPLDGEGLGIGIIKYLEKFDCYSIITSHYDGIKKLSLKDEKIQNGAMIFDEKDIKPTFKFKEGLIGKSYALEVASNLGLNKEILAYAKQYIIQSTSFKEKEMLDKLEKLQLENNKLNEDYKKKLEELNHLNKKREEAIKALALEKENIVNQASEKIEKFVLEEKKKLEAMYLQNKIDLKQMAKLKGELSKISNKKAYAENKPKVIRHVFNIGDKVMVNSISQVGNIENINVEKKQVTVNINGIITNTSLNNLTFLEAPKVEKKKVSSIDNFISLKNNVPIQLNIIGLRADEAKSAVEKYLDDVLLARYHQVRIIHGFGSGILRKVVNEVLKKNKYVESFRSGGENEGGLGATVVNLRS